MRRGSLRATAVHLDPVFDHLPPDEVGSNVLQPLGCAIVALFRQLDNLCTKPAPERTVEVATDPLVLDVHGDRVFTGDVDGAKMHREVSGAEEKLWLAYIMTSDRPFQSGLGVAGDITESALPALLLEMARNLVSLPVRLEAEFLETPGVRAGVHVIRQTCSSLVGGVCSFLVGRVCFFLVGRVCSSLVRGLCTSRARRVCSSRVRGVWSWVRREKLSAPW